MKISTKNNEYFYDNNTGLILPGAEVILSIMNIENWKIKSENEIINLLINMDKESIVFYHSWLIKYEDFKSNLTSNNHFSNINEDLIKSSLLHNGFKELILSVTEDCNFRCSYCVYSENFSDTRNHSKNYMNWETAKKAIDIYLNYFKEGKKFNLFREPVFGFYGGEPLLNFDLIKKIVNYIKTIYDGTFILNITTNGSLLTQDIADWLMENNFSIIISLDGDKKEHDRKRSYANHTETFDDVFNNIKYLLKKNYESVYVNSVFDWKTNFEECDSFFKNINLKVANVSEVNKITTKDYYNQFDSKELDLFNEYFSLLEENYVITLKNQGSYLFELIEYPLVSTILNSNILNVDRNLYNFAGSCIPGEKIFVNHKGEFFICERVPEIKSIGNISEGVNFKVISNFIEEYNNNLSFCKECEFSFICNKCFNDFIINNDLKNSSDVCYDEESIMKNFLSRSLNFLEKSQNIVEKNYIKYFNWYNWRD